MDSPANCWVTDSRNIAKDSGVFGGRFGRAAGTGDWVVFKIDFVGLHSLDGVKDLTSGLDFTPELANDGGLIYFGDSEKFTFLEVRVDGAPVEPLPGRGESPGVRNTAGESSGRSFSS
jgi:hypothetical protein